MAVVAPAPVVVAVDPPAAGAAQQRFSPTAAATTLVYLLSTIGLWYGTRGSWFGRDAMVVPIYFCGTLVLWAALRSDGFRLRDLQRETWVVAVTSLVLLGLLWHFGRRPHYALWFGPQLQATGLTALRSFFFFSAAAIVARVILPLVTARLVLGRGPADYGYRLRGTFELWWLYALALVVGVAAVSFASSLPAFLRAYPRCRDAIVGGELGVTTLLVYLSAYGLVFLSGEAFWRGYILFGLERQLGRNALLFMLIPYVVGHFGKPLLETLGAIATGSILGYLALRHRSFWLGVAVHWGVAISMDLAALLRRGVSLTFS